MIQTDLFKTRFIPSKASSQKLMLVFHGRGDSMKPFRKFNLELGIPEMNYLLVNAPRRFLKGFSWYGEPPFQKSGVLKLRQKLFHLLQQLEKSGWKSENIFLLGFSQGSLVSADLALNYPKKLGGVVGISGYFQFFPRWRRQLVESNRRTPWLMTHGHRDKILKIEETRYGVHKLKTAGLHIDWVELDKSHTFEEKEYSLIRRWVKKNLRYPLGTLRPRKLFDCKDHF